MKVKFVTDAVIQENGVEKKLFEAGAEVDLNDASAERWKRRGVAVFLDSMPPDPSLGTIVKEAPTAPAGDAPAPETKAPAAGGKKRKG